MPPLSYDPTSKAPHHAADRIVAELLADLPEERRKAVRDAIEAAIDAWAEVVGDPANFTG